tara:strand:+ start:367 stop:693 length:327 start_codon:yes stop_codon:yes gene_type:complete
MALDYTDFKRDENGEVKLMNKDDKKPMLEPKRKRGEGLSKEEKIFGWKLLESNLERLTFDTFKRKLEDFSGRTDIKAADYSILRSYFRYGKLGLNAYTNNKSLGSLDG